MKKTILRQLLMLSKRLLYGFLIQLFFCTVLLANTGNAQRKTLEEVKISVDLTDKSLSQFFKLVEAKTDFRFTFSDNIVDLKRTVSVVSSDGSLYDILVAVSQQTNLSFVQVNENIHVKAGKKKDKAVEVARLVVVTVTGKVTDENGEPMPGATITIEGSTSGTVTDIDGNFSIDVEEGAVLLVSFIGYQTKRITVANQSRIDIQMEYDNQQLDEVVVTGYGSQKKSDITGSVSVVNVESLQSIPTGSVTNALQGQAAGVSVVNSGAPGGDNQITIRGMTSFGNNNPLVLIDGVQGNLDLINVNEIESIQVLKDAGAAAIYGVRGSNGVIIVTTKNAKAGTLTVNYDSYVGVTLPHRNNPLNLVNSREWWSLMQTGFPNDAEFQTQLPDYMYRSAAGSAQFAFEGDPVVDPSNYVLDPSNPTNNYIIAKINKSGTNLYSEVFKPAIQNNHTITVSGGSDKSKALFAINYLDEQGTVIETFHKRISARVNSEYKVGKNIRIGENLNLYYRSQDLTDFSWSSVENVIARILFSPPITPIYDIAGNYNGAFTSPTTQNQYNPVFIQKSRNNSRNNTFGLIGNVFAEVDFLKDFTFRSSMGGNFSNNYLMRFRPVDYTSATAFAGVNELSENSGYNYNYIFTNTLKYSKTFGEHQIDVIAGSEAVENGGRSLRGSRQDFYLSDFPYLLLGNGRDQISNSSSVYKNTLFSLFGRLDYSYKSKYLLGATIRRDGSSVFGPNSRYGFFPSVSVAWRLSGESFMDGASWIDELKLRASYGVMGSQSNVNNDNQFSLFGSGLGSSFYDITGSSTSTQQGFYTSRFGNNNTGWEKNIVYNFGVDATLIRKIDLSVEVYKKNISGLLFPQPLPNTTGGATPPSINIGDVENRGIDISASYRGIVSNDFDFTIGANITHYVNEIKSIPGSTFFDVGDNTNAGLGSYIRNQEGHSIGEFYGYQIERLFQSDADVAESPTQQDAIPGRFKYADIHGDLYEDGTPNGIINSFDRTFIGNPHPDFTYGINLGMNYKNFDFSTVIYGSYGNDAINIIKSRTHFSYAKWQLHKEVLDHWTPENTDSNIPIYTGPGTFSSGAVASSFYVEDASFLKVRTLVMGYSLPAGFLGRINVDRFRVFLQASNLLQITKYSGLDPEIPLVTDGRLGIDAGNYPNNQRGFNIGFNVGF
jgi:TonB-linked SusC/RagA family outer membrane protein